MCDGVAFGGGQLAKGLVPPIPEPPLPFRLLENPSIPRPTHTRANVRGEALKACPITICTLEARAFTFGGTEGSMLGRRGWFDAVTKRFGAGKKGMIRCCDKNNGSMLNRKKGLMVVNIKIKKIVKHISSHTYYLPHQFTHSVNCYYYFHHRK
jgi:hypothetical protein